MEIYVTYEIAILPTIDGLFDFITSIVDNIVPSKTPGSPQLLLGVHEVEQSVGLFLHVLEDVPRVQELGVQPVGGQEAFAHHEDLRRLVARGLRLGGPHLPEQLSKNPVQGEVVFGAEDLGHEPPAFPQKLRRQLQGVQSQLR